LSLINKNILRGNLSLQLRKRVTAELLRFPESKALSPEELQDAVDRIMKESRPETASVASPGMLRMSNDDIRIRLVLLKTPTVDDILGVEASGVFPPDWIQKRRLLLEEQCRHKTNARAVKYCWCCGAQDPD
jgi:hypothetical protein